MYFDTSNISDASFLHNVASGLITCGFRKDTAIVCIGTDRAIYDIFGPLVGQFLKESNIDINVYGTIEEPIHYKNMFDIIPEIQKKESHILCIDAIFGDKDSLNKVTVQPKGSRPGSGLDKKTFERPVGNLKMGYVVADDDMPASEVKRMRMNDIYFVAKRLVEAIKLAKVRVGHASIYDNVINFESKRMVK